jgi:hypothetical protein
MKNFIALSTLLLLGSVTAVAADLRHARLLVQESIDHAQRARHPHDGELWRAEDKLSVVQRDTYHLRPSYPKQQLERSLDEALRALRDYRMPHFHKTSIVVRSGSDALQAIDELMRNDRGRGDNRQLAQALDLIERSLHLIRQDRTHQAQTLLDDVRSLLNPFDRDRDIQLAQREISHLSSRLSDRWMSPRERIALAEDTTRTARDAILRSRAYREGDGRDGRHPGDPRELGRTRNYMSHYPTVQDIHVNAHGGNVRELVLTAHGSSIRIDSLEVLYSSGVSEMFYGGFIQEHNRLNLVLRSREPSIRRIRITAQSAGGHRHRDGHIVVHGIR